MRLGFATLTALGLLFGTSAVQAADNPGASGNSPGYQKNEQGSVPGSPGASGYSPGHQTQDQGSVPGSPGASGYAPGKQGSNQNEKSDHGSPE